LTTSAYDGKSLLITGPEALSFAEITARIGAAIGEVTNLSTSLRRGGSPTVFTDQWLGGGNGSPRGTVACDSRRASCSGEQQCPAHSWPGTDCVRPVADRERGGIPMIQPATRRIRLLLWNSSDSRAAGKLFRLKPLPRKETIIKVRSRFHLREPPFLESLRIADIPGTTRLIESRAFGDAYLAMQLKNCFVSVPARGFVVEVAISESETIRPRPSACVIKAAALEKC
jgi:hypothetical protein